LSAIKTAALKRLRLSIIVKIEKKLAFLPFVYYCIRVGFKSSLNQKLSIFRKFDKRDRRKVGKVVL